MWALIIFLFSGWSSEVCMSVAAKSFLPDNNCNPIAVDNEGGAFVSWGFNRTYRYYTIHSIHIDRFNSRGHTEYLDVSWGGGNNHSILGAGNSNVLYKDSTVYYIWDDRMLPVNGVDYENEVFYRVYYWNINYGTFGSILGVTSNDLKYSYCPSACMDENGTIYTVWEDLRTGIPQVFYKKYQDGVWSDAKQISQSPYFAVYPSVTANNGKAYIFWEDGRDKAIEIYMREIDGDSISPEQRVTDDDGYFSYGIHSASGNDGSVHIVWTDEKDGYPQVYYKKYSNNVWSNPINISNSSTDAVSPSIYIDIWGKKHIVWADRGEDEGNIYYIVPGDTFSHPVKVNETTIKCENPFVAVDTMGMVYIIWTGIYEGKYSNQPQLIFRRYTPDKNAKSTKYSSTVVLQGPLVISGNNKKYNRAVVYDIIGRKIKTIFPKNGKLIWRMDGKGGRKVKDGIYFLHIEGENTIMSKKVVYIGGKK